MALINDEDFFQRQRDIGGEITIRTPQQPTLVQIPANFFPHADYENATWIRLTPRELTNINARGRGGTYTLRKTGTIYKFLCPREVVEVHNHDWREYESFHSAVLEKIRSYKTGYTQISGAAGRAGNEINDIIKNGFGGDFLKRLEEAARNISAVDVPQLKMDTPLTWQGSSRRVYNFDFLLADADGGDLVLDTVQAIQKYAAPKNRDDLRIDFPYVFSIESEPRGMINLKAAACTSIQPTYREPFNQGKPYICNLNLSFVDLSPLFESTIDSGGIITIEEVDKEKK